MSLLRDLFWLSAIYNFEIKGKFLSERSNMIGDAASRLHEDGQLSKLYDLLTSYNHIPFKVEELLRHVTFAFYFSRWYRSDDGFGDGCWTVKKQGMG